MVQPAPPPPPAARLAGVGSSPVRDLLALVSSAKHGDLVSFAGGLPAPELFDSHGLRDAFDSVLRDDPRRALQYSPTEGDPRLSDWIAARHTGRGLPTDPAQVIVTTGSQQGLSLVAAALLDPGDTVLVEEPGYLAALQCFRLAGARVATVATDDDGTDPDALAEAVQRHRPKLLYLVPTFQNPTGRTLPHERRAAIAAVAARHGLWIVEDDPYSELRYAGAPLPSLAAYDGAADRTVVLGSMSKVMSPGMRLGWVRAPEPLRPSLAVAKQAADLHTSTIDQAAAAVYLAEADFPAHIDRLCAAYRPRRDAMLAGLPDALPPGSTWTRPQGGMFVWVRLPEGADAQSHLRAALDNGVAFVPGAPFYAERPDPATLRLSFTTHTPEEIGKGLARLGAVLTRRTG
ncbi:PLP-dependent aminotransferase family protein [Streptomonospora nanhaiensis]|uniref:2-aminoadipate transaminase n=1 Tax=Streptomonospora nanhaiensis TaxID=1323731 RepID=A0A853BNF1_9ACTN|nr:PLP-dependent aminotransferase family protein [Streptomonospora nanhaiensis]MBV2366711.1 PLP-dependent aminotransferase family protein [Streptomonospora nanhaiensis]MBX9387619.1 PLP-dependent aminotransferase family protein [Streptomonospora nanhaiensis]NYI97149.1 2-aminoadipate transaminase [Streptomonospora nanhaiensis]